MIKIGIAGADTPLAGELLRIVSRHPDVDILSAYAPDKAGRPVSSVHHGFIGESKLNFTSHFDATGLDVAFLLRPIYSESDWVKLMADQPELRLILFPGTLGAAMATDSAPVYGLSEIYRKPMVRGARVVRIPDCIAAPALVALFPLALHLLLRGNLEINVYGPEDILTLDRVRQAEEEIRDQLARIQSSFTGNVVINASPVDSPRGLRLHMKLPVMISVEEALKLYDSVYDDHNFSHVVTYPVSTSEVEGTEKVIVSVSSSDDGMLTLDIISDPRMRGGAGEAVHIMNLLMGLHEKTGLDLKPSVYI